MCSFVHVYHIPLRQGFSLKVQSGWQPARPRDPLVLVPVTLVLHIGLENQARFCYLYFALQKFWGSKLWSSCWLSNRFYLLIHMPNPRTQNSNLIYKSILKSFFYTLYYFLYSHQENQYYLAYDKFIFIYSKKMIVSSELHIISTIHK